MMCVSLLQVLSVAVVGYSVVRTATRTCTSARSTTRRWRRSRSARTIPSSSGRKSRRYKGSLGKCCTETYEVTAAVQTGPPHAATWWPLCVLLQCDASSRDTTVTPTDASQTSMTPRPHLCRRCLDRYTFLTRDVE